MSLKPILVRDPRVAVRTDNELNHVVHAGGSRTTQYVETSSSYQLAVAPVQTNFTISPPSDSTIIDRFIRVRHYLEITTNAAMELGINDGVFQLPNPIAFKITLIGVPSVLRVIH